MSKRLYRSTTQKVFAGVCGGFGDYFEVDPVLVRIIAVILFFAHGVGFLAYMVAWIVMPKRPVGEPVSGERHYSSWHKYLPGVILIAIGAALLLREFWYWFDFGEMWAVLLILAGLGLIFLRSSKRNEGTESQHVNGHNMNSHNGMGSV
ncbi:MAG TPA: PspC domain-containing protein [Acidobacteriota bacterium]|nr:PspC domain-containing protein [Acidobacteriota bacterium]